MACAIYYSDPGSVYPVWDPRRTAGEFPMSFGYKMAWDIVIITIDKTFSLTNCQMLVGLEAGPGITWQKDILAWNYFLGGPVASVTTVDQNTGPNFMLIQKGNCLTGAHTLLLRKLMNTQMTGLYTLQSADLWTFWGGKKVTLTWVKDDGGSGVWEPDTPPIVYPVVQFPDGTLLRSSAQPGVVFVVFGGCKVSSRSRQQPRLRFNVGSGCRC
jgi:hypothetical protein